MEKAFQKGFLLSKSGSEKPKKPTAECNNSKKQMVCNNPESETKTMDKAIERGFLLDNPATKEKKIMPKINQTMPEESPAQEVSDEKHDNVKSPLLELPRELLEHIFMFLDPNSVKSVACVSKWWNEVVEKPSLWKWAKAKMWQPSLSGDGCTREELYENGLHQLEIEVS